MIGDNLSPEERNKIQEEEIYRAQVRRSIDETERQKKLDDKRQRRQDLLDPPIGFLKFVLIALGANLLLMFKVIVGVGLIWISIWTIVGVVFFLPPYLVQEFGYPNWTSIFIYIFYAIIAFFAFRRFGPGLNRWIDRH
jgi:hypothetical protein